MVYHLLGTIISSTPENFLGEKDGSSIKLLQLLLLRILDFSEEENSFFLMEEREELKTAILDLKEIIEKLQMLTTQKLPRLETGKNGGWRILASENLKTDLINEQLALVRVKNISRGEKLKLRENGLLEIFTFQDWNDGWRYFLRQDFFGEEIKPAVAGLSSLLFSEESLRYFLKRLWGFNDFRGSQMELIEKIFWSRNILGILPTGGGKSLCFQLPALFIPGTSLIVAPLKSLIQDQVRVLKKRGWNWAGFIDSSLRDDQRKRMEAAWENRKLKLLYVAPERMQIERFQKRLKNNLGLVIIDEAHCVSEWGHDFRPAYLKMATEIPRLKPKKIVGLTATASSKVEGELKDLLDFGQENIIKSREVDRPEIALAAKKVGPGQCKRKLLQKILFKDIPAFFKEDSLENVHVRGTGIIFTPYAGGRGSFIQKSSCERLKPELEKHGLIVDAYHGKLEDEKRKEVQKDYLRNDFPLLLATKGFGMGIDKPDIKYIIHFNYPASLEGYFQEVGRAGRAGQKALALIIFRPRKRKCLKRERRSGDLVPPCNSGWSCRFADEELCDYGVQIKFINQKNPAPERITPVLKRFLQQIKQKRGKEIRFTGVKEKILFQRFLLFLQNERLIKDFVIEDYYSDGPVFKIMKNRRNRYLQDKILQKYFRRELEIKRERIGALKKMEKYAENEGKNCRRRLLLQYLGQEINEGVSCDFCDSEGFNKNKANSVLASGPALSLKGKASNLLAKRTFDWLEFRELREYAVKKEFREQLLNLARAKIQENPAGAYYLIGMLTAKTAEREKYLIKCLHYLEEQKNRQGIIEILKEITVFSPKLSLKMVAHLKNREGLLDCGHYFIDPEEKRAFSLLCISGFLKSINKLTGEVYSGRFTETAGGN